ncbi:MAG: N-acetyl-gamma-glutamyl-phosphate reductase [Oscillospiraceae bacterium]|nr:N-acetyl-gamma-glutamyl-phosphate reductase [Candidatus Ruminococcus equi]
MTKVFIDGGAGTTGLRLKDRLKDREDIELLTLPDEYRKDISHRKEMINNSDITFFCLPDDAAKEALTLVDNPNTVIIDTSTAHRTDERFIYGMPELLGQKERIENAKRITNPGCHASGFIALVAPLTHFNIIKKDKVLSCFSLTGYSGGGKKMIADYESENRDTLLEAPRVYGLSQSHKHLPEMQKYSGLENNPVFLPTVAPYYCGMEVLVPLSKDDIGISLDELKTVYKDYYKSGLIRFCDNTDENGFLSANKLSYSDMMEISVVGNDERIVLVSRFDNLGKGASGAAIQNMNIVLKQEMSLGLVVK